MACKQNCKCFICEAKKIKIRNKENNLNKLANDFQNKSGGIITKKDIYEFAKNYNKGR